MERIFSRERRGHAFTLLEVALIVAIIGMMLMMIVGYLLAPKQKGPLPPVAEATPIPSAATPSAPGPLPTPVPPTAAPTPAKATPAATPASAIELSPQSPPSFR